MIVLDSSPVLPVTDPLLFARHADGVIVALLLGVSRMPLADEAYQRLSAGTATIVDLLGRPDGIADVDLDVPVPRDTARPADLR